MGMPTIRAVVLTCDRYRPFTEHMLFMYERIWPDHPFQFVIPYQEIPPSWPFSRANRIEAKQTPLAIRQTVLSLLEGLDDEEMIYWCIDDKYPIRLNLTRIKAIVNWLSSGQATAIDGILFCRCRRMWEPAYLTGSSTRDSNNNIYLERKGYEQIWIHQFIRVKVLRHLFESMPEAIGQAKEMDLLKKKVQKPTHHRIYVSRGNLARFGESTCAGIITANCQASMQRYNLKITPEMESSNHQHLIVGSARDELVFDPDDRRMGIFWRALAGKIIH